MEVRFTFALQYGSLMGSLATFPGTEPWKRDLFLLQLITTK